MLFRKKKEKKIDLKSALKTIRGLVAALLIVAGLFLLAAKAAWFPSPGFMSDFTEALAISLIVLAAVEIYYGTTLTERYFEKRFSRTLAGALTQNNYFLERRTVDELKDLSTRTMSALAGKEKDQDDQGLYELVHKKIVPVLGHIYREDYRIVIGQSKIEAGTHTYLKVKSKVSYAVVNPTKEKQRFTIQLWGDYDILEGVNPKDLYGIDRLAVDRQEMMLKPVELVVSSVEGRQGFHFEDDIELAPAGEETSRRTIEFEDYAVMEIGDMETFRPNDPTNNITVEVFPEDCQAQVDFFAFGTTIKTLKFQNACTWEYQGWLLPGQGFALHFKLPEHERVLTSSD